MFKCLKIKKKVESILFRFFRRIFRFSSRLGPKTQIRTFEMTRAEHGLTSFETHGTGRVGDQRKTGKRMQDHRERYRHVCVSTNETGHSTACTCDFRYFFSRYKSTDERSWIKEQVDPPIPFHLVVVSRHSEPDAPSLIEIPSRAENPPFVLVGLVSRHSQPTSHN